MENKQFSIHLLKWYEKNKRDLPWRHTKNPYAIWISEIIMQQTRISQGLDYYLRFLDHYPDIYAFAAAPEDEILKLWQGLGYYSRARYMITTARLIVTQYEGKFPSSYEGLLKLKGIGKYTAAEIASISFNEPVAAVDGNVLRVFTRFAGIREPIEKASVQKSIRSSLELLIDKKKPADFNQAMMDLGATCCTPRMPDCHRCPINYGCFAFAEGLQEQLPVKKSKLKPRNRHFHYLVMHSGPVLFIRKRSGNDIWKALYEFPMIETPGKVPLNVLLAMDELKAISGNRKIEILNVSGPYKHQLSHQTIFATFYRLKLEANYKPSNPEYLNILAENLEKYAFPRLIEKYLDDNGFIE